MVISERDRNEMHNRLVEVLGPDQAATLMAHLPPIGWADVATKQDLAALERNLRSDFRSEIAGLRVEIANTVRTTVLATVLANVALVTLAAGYLSAVR